MRTNGIITVSGILAIVLGAMIVSDAVAAQTEREDAPPVYNPYPPGILPSDLKYARRVQVQRDLRALPGRYDRESRLLALAGGSEQP
jgi:hypothetical protein